MKIVENNINTGFLNKHFVVTASPKANCYTISGTDINFVGSVSIKEGFRFSNVDIEESGKIEVRIDLEDNADFNGRKIKFSKINSEAFSSLVYEDTRRLDVNEVAGYVSLSDLTIQPSKAALKNNLTKAVEFLSGDSATKVVFDGTYSAKNGTVKLTEWTVK
jgi:hypothetical protein